MTTYISLLRGINVSGQKLIKMDVLKTLYEELDFLNIRTYLQSGNVVFQYREADPSDLEMRIATQIKKYSGFEVPVSVLKNAALKDIVKRNPYTADKTKDISYLYVTFLFSRPGQINFETINKVKSPGEELTLIEKAVYLYCPNGYGKSRLTNTSLEKKLNTRATTRNWKTTLELLNIAEGLK